MLESPSLGTPFPCSNVDGAILTGPLRGSRRRAVHVWVRVCIQRVCDICMEPTRATRTINKLNPQKYITTWAYDMVYHKKLCCFGLWGNTTEF